MADERWKHLEVRTDLALEARESCPGDGGEVEGVAVNVWNAAEEKLKVTEVVVLDQNGAKAMGKPVGTYITLEAPELAEKDEDFHREVVKELAGQIRKLMVKHHVWNVSEYRAPSVLAVGLGNMAATPDSLGPRVLENLQVTRHLSLEYGKEFCERNGYPVLSGLTPGVMAQTGMETAEIVTAVVKETRPDLLIVVDALAARSAKRLGVTIQLSDTGIHPGSGVGNHRNQLNEDVLHIPVLALGVPTVIGAAAVVHDTVDALVGALGNEKKEGTDREEDQMDQTRLFDWVRSVLELEFGPMYVTPHDIDERVKTLSYTLSEAIHEALFA